MGDDREKAPLCKGAFGAMQPGKTILDKSRASPVDCSLFPAGREQHLNILPWQDMQTSHVTFF